MYDLCSEKLRRALFQVEEFLSAFEGEGAIDEDEQKLLDALDRVERENPTRQRIRQIFGGMDNDNSGFVTHTELKEGLMELGVAADSEDMDTLLMEIDVDGDGRVGMYSGQTLEHFNRNKRENYPWFLEFQ
jgi:Ca2+-binding EF-hand superfamily protein